jgi:S-adenosylmethionine decarboxylase
MPLGRHLILECYGCDINALKNTGRLEQVLQESALAAKAIILHSYFHKFDRGEGVTGVVALSESHISVHTWPEHGYMAIDVFMCGDCDPMHSVDYILDNILIERHTVSDLERGEP